MFWKLLDCTNGRLLALNRFTIKIYKEFHYLAIIEVTNKYGLEACPAIL